MNALERIIEYKKTEVLALKHQISVSELEKRALSAPPARGFIRALSEKSATGQNALICELKRKSPSAGDIMPGADPVAIAQEYENGGATCLSVLTDGPSFGGSLEDLVNIRKAVSLPILRKDFMIDPVQILEARAIEADCILIILSALSDQQASELMNVATQCGLDILTEVHDEEELDRAKALGAELIGVNNRDLKHMTTDLGVSERLSKRHQGLPLVSESGVKTPSDIARLRRSGFGMFLIGESLMKETNRESSVDRIVKTV